MDGGRVVIRGSKLAAALREFWMRIWLWNMLSIIRTCRWTWSTTNSRSTMAAIASTIGTARGTTHGSCLPRAAKEPGVPSYCAVACAWEMVAGDLKPTLCVKKNKYEGAKWASVYQCDFTESRYLDRS